jgi:hypothetical protein
MKGGAFVLGRSAAKLDVANAKLRAVAEMSNFAIGLSSERMSLNTLPAIETSARGESRGELRQDEAAAAFCNAV